jgi:hypothetical protein
MFRHVSNGYRYLHGRSFPDTTEVTMRGGGIIGTILLVWLIIGVIATWQRGYFKGQDTSCATMGTIAVTVVAGPLNYMGVNPQVKDCHANLPQPSSMNAVDLVPSM